MCSRAAVFCFVLFFLEKVVRTIEVNGETVLGGGGGVGPPEPSGCPPSLPLVERDMG